MAHSCPGCDDLCYCDGDIDDSLFDIQPSERCSHVCWDEDEAWREEEERDEERSFERLRTHQLEEDPPA